MNLPILPPQNTSAPNHPWRQLNERYIAHCLPSAERIQFRTAVTSIEYWAMTSPDRVRSEFESMLKAIEQIYLIARILRDEGYPDGLNTCRQDERWRRGLKRRLFRQLSDRAQRILLSQGVRI